MITPPILAIDFGKKHIGLAVSDYKGIVATPLDVIHITKNSTMETILNDISNVVTEYRVKSLLFGVPQSFEKAHDINKDRIDRFIAVVINKLQLPYTTIDESFSTSSARFTFSI